MLVSPIKTLLVDDEFQSRKLLRYLIQKHSNEIAIIGEAHDARCAYSLICHMQPQLVFLDIMMPVETGFELLDRFGTINFEIIFTTAHREFARKATQYNPLDYLLKPIDTDELLCGIEKARRKILSCY